VSLPASQYDASFNRGEGHLQSGVGVEFDHASVWQRQLSPPTDLGGRGITELDRPTVPRGKKRQGERGRRCDWHQYGGDSAARSANTARARLQGEVPLRRAAIDGAQDAQRLEPARCRREFVVSFTVPRIRFQPRRKFRFLLG
jgi:hypothetical protein